MCGIRGSGTTNLSNLVIARRFENLRCFFTFMVNWKQWKDEIIQLRSQTHCYVAIGQKMPTASPALAAQASTIIISAVFLVTFYSPS